MTDKHIAFYYIDYDVLDLKITEGYQQSVYDFLIVLYNNNCVSSKFAKRRQLQCHQSLNFLCRDVPDFVFDIL